MTDIELHKLINRYFDGDTTLDEERALRRALATPPRNASKTDALADEARAVMGFSLAAPARKTRHVMPWRGVAAVAVTAIVDTSILTGNFGHNEPEYVAYLNGEKIADSNTVMNLMLSDLHEMGAASESMESDISENFNAIADAMNNLE